MKFFPKLLLMLVPPILASACYLPVSTDPGPDGLDRYNRAAQSWPGAHVDELLAAWPSQWFKGQSTLADGSSAYTFVRQEQYFRQAEQYYDHAHNEWVEKTPAAAELSICETKFITNSQGVITSVQTGNYQCGQTAAPPSRAQK